MPLRKRLLDLGGLAFDQDLMLAFGQRKGKRTRMAVGYQLLWAVAEDSGCYEANLKSIAKLSGFLEFTERELAELVQILTVEKNILSYFSQRGVECHWLVNFRKHQPLNNPSLPRVPLPPWLIYEVKKYKSGKEFAVYYLLRDRLPEGYRDITSSLPEPDKETLGRLLVVPETETETETKRNETETKKGGGSVQPDVGGNGKGQGAFGAPPEEKAQKPTDQQKLELAVLCDRIMTHFGIPASYVPGVNEQRWRQRFHPYRFVQTTISQRVPVEVTLKVLRSMDRQKERIDNPYAWLIEVMRLEWQSYSYEQEIREHIARKNSGPGDILGGVIS